MRARFIIGSIFIILGVSAVTGYDFGRFIGPLLLITLGFFILTRSNKGFTSSSSTSHEDTLNEVYVFSGTQRKITTTEFTGGKVVAVFGGVEVDLSEVKTKKELIELEVVAVFGGIRIKVPEQIKITSDTTAILGGVDNKTNPDAKGPILHIHGAAIFGGIELFT